MRTIDKILISVSVVVAMVAALWLTTTGHETPPPPRVLEVSSPSDFSSSVEPEVTAQAIEQMRYRYSDWHAYSALEIQRMFLGVCDRLSQGATILGESARLHDDYGIYSPSDSYDGVVGAIVWYCDSDENIRLSMEVPPQ